MTQYAPVMTSQYYQDIAEGKNAMWLANGLSEAASPMDDPVIAALAHTLALELPGFDWTIEVDVLGRHRITVHFKGGSIAIDE